MPTSQLVSGHAQVRKTGPNAREKKSTNPTRSDIAELERTVNTLVRRPTLIRREYWRSEVERLLARSDITLGDRERLNALHHLLQETTEECGAHFN